MESAVPGERFQNLEEQQACSEKLLIPTLGNQIFPCSCETQVPYLPVLHFVILPHQPGLSDQLQGPLEPT